MRAPWTSSDWPEAGYAKLATIMQDHSEEANNQDRTVVAFVIAQHLSGKADNHEERQ